VVRRVGDVRDDDDDSRRSGARARRRTRDGRHARARARVLLPRSRLRRAIRLLCRPPHARRSRRELPQQALGRVDPRGADLADRVMSRLHHLVLPAATIATLGVAYYARVVRTEMIDVLGEDYIRTARAKGVPERAVVWRHALRNALGPLVTVIGLDLGLLLGG